MCAQKVGAALRIVIGRYGYKSSFGANKLSPDYLLLYVFNSNLNLRIGINSTNFKGGQCFQVSETAELKNFSKQRTKYKISANQNSSDNLCFQPHLVLLMY